MSTDGSSIAIRGAIEGFYGTYYTFPERNDLLRFLGQHDFNYWLYAPKNDRQHRARWWEPYPAGVLDNFAETIRVARHAGVTFCYAISFGTPIDFSSASHFEAVTQKFQCFLDRGCRSFGVLYDDSPTYFSEGRASEHFQSPAHAHYDFSNRLLEWLRGREPGCSFYVCPVDYFGVAPFSAYVTELGHGLHPDIRLFYTGPAVCSRAITLEDVTAFRQATGRRPMLWDNYPVNDLQMRPELHIGPLTGRSGRLAEGVCGYAANLMNQAEASKIPLLTIAKYLRDPESYSPQTAWELALRELAGDESYPQLRIFASTSLASCLTEEEAPELDRLALDALHQLRDAKATSESPMAIKLQQYLDALDEAVYHLRNRMSNLALRQNLLPWIDAIDDKLWLGRFALLALRALEQGEDTRPDRERLREQLEEVKRQPKRIGGKAVITLAVFVYARVRQADSDLQPRAQEGGIRPSKHSENLDDTQALLEEA